MTKLLNIRRRAGLAGLFALASVLAYPASTQTAAVVPGERCSP
ncbi:hypothetical protein ACIOHB_36650 [Streptomyces microflavus]